MTTRRDWSLAEYKRQDGCRVGYHEGYESCEGDVELAHTVGRKYDEPGPWLHGRPNPGNQPLRVLADAVVPLCKMHHLDYDIRRLDLLPYLTLEEQAYAASKLGLVRALKRVGGEPPSEEVPK